MGKAMALIVDAALAIEKVRVRTQVRQTHLSLRGRVDPETDALLEKLIEIERYTDGRATHYVAQHPTYPWFSMVKGVGKENIIKVVAQIDIERATTISALWKFAGYAVVDGHAPRRTKGKKLDYNSRLRIMCWRLGDSLIKATGKFYDYYLNEKDKYIQRYENEGKKIVPASALPTDSNGKRYEPAGIISEGHVHNQAKRKMIKLFLACLWLVWREAEGLPVTAPYAIDRLGHDSIIQPEDMVDRAMKRKKPTRSERAIS